MKKIFIFIFVMLCVFFSFADQKNPVFFLEKIVEESRPALISRNDEFLEKTMEKYIDFEESVGLTVRKTTPLAEVTSATS